MKFLTNNLQLKILALLSATALWFFVIGIENTVYRFPQEIDIHATNVTSDLSLASDLGKVKLMVRASADDFKNLTKSDFDVSVDLKNYQAGEYQVPILANVKNDKIALVRVEPQTVYVKLEPITEKKVKIKVAVNGNPQKGYIVKDIKLDDDSATISGSQSLIAKIDSIDATLNLDGSQSTNFKTNLALKLSQSLSESSDEFTNITIKPEQVTAEITVAPALQQKTVVVKANIQGSIDLYSWAQKLEITPLTVVITGEQETLNAINYLDTEPIKVEQLKGQTKGVKAKLIIPKGVSLMDSEPNAVMLLLKVEST